VRLGRGSVWGPHGSAAFARDAAPGRPIPEIPRRQSDPVPPGLAELLPEGTGAEIAAAYREHGYTLAEIGSHLGRHYTTISRRLRAYEASERMHG
jgi:hypothetical protein